ncbi:SWIM zinc finger family protein [Myxococcus eversor]|uniref:SWIM zinc finger family protein n=1 Tax=Myxococcus eversor TaxID=2709661 RepID=UPI0013D10D0E|nr:SWIM zinc finger family protein [Myxococcus eversor]
MTVVDLLYATPSVFESTRERALLGLSADQHRPVRFHAKVAKDVLPIRLALQALGQLIWQSDEWSSEWMGGLMDPIITVHPDRVFFEAFSQDQSSYGMVIVDRSRFEPEGEVRCGTTNVDFTAWLWAALAEMRSSRETHLRVGAEGFEVRTKGSGGRFEQKVEVPDEWVRGFLQLQGGMAMPGTKLTVRPVDLLSAVRHLTFTKAKVSPRALRYVLTPGHDAKLVLEPWEHEVPLRGATHGATEPRTVRTWGRRRLRLLEPLLPYADKVDIYLKGRALPHFYAVHLGPGVRFVLGLSGWTANRWTGTAGMDLLLEPEQDSELTERVLGLLRERVHVSTEEVAQALGVSKARAAGALAGLCAAGRAIFDVEARSWRHRELFTAPVDLGRLYPPDARREEAERLAAADAVKVTSETTRETRKVRKLPTPAGAVVREVVYRDWVVHGHAGTQQDVELVLNDEDRLLFGKCGCEYFREHLMNQGPCAHLLALLRLAKARRKELASSVPASAEALTVSAAEAAARRPRNADTDDDSEADDTEALDEDGGDDDNR